MKVKAAAVGAALMGRCGWMGRQVAVAISMQAEGLIVSRPDTSCAGPCSFSFPLSAPL